MQETQRQRKKTQSEIQKRKKTPKDNLGLMKKCIFINDVVARIVMDLQQVVKGIIMCKRFCVLIIKKHVLQRIFYDAAASDGKPKVEAL